LQVGWFWFLGTLVPVIGLVQVGGQAMADRYTYIPSVGLFVLLIWGAFESTRRWRQQVVGLTMVGIAAIAACCAMTWHQLGYWKNSETLFRHTLAVTEKNEVVHNILGTTLGDKGQVNEAISEFREAIRIKPDYGQAHYNLGYALFTKGQLDKAMAEFQEAIRLKPDYQARFDNLSKIMEMNNLAWQLATGSDARIRDGAQAVELAERACKLTNYRIPIMVGTLAAAYAEAGWFDEAIATGQKACALASESGETNLLKSNQQLVALYQTHQPFHESSKAGSP
jgi:tetratricopeptide (TPR) repeat protein